MPKVDESYEAESPGKEKVVFEKNKKGVEKG
jgi:hypothetical protein